MRFDTSHLRLEGNPPGSWPPPFASLVLEPCEPRTLLAVTFIFSVSDAPPVLRPGPGGQAEAVFTVSLSSANIEQDLFVDYTTVDGTAVASHGDYVPVSGILNFPFNETSLTQTVAGPDPVRTPRPFRSRTSRW